jgi:CheY-like chemotaxis protein
MHSNSKLRIILLDDSDAIRTVLAELLRRRGYEVFTFSKPTICPLQILPECRCTPDQACTDVILTDVNMPEMDGLQFIENLKNKNCKCRHVAIMSGWLSPGNTYRAEQLGCKIFAKPLNMDSFCEWLDGIHRVANPSRELCNWFQSSS